MGTRERTDLSASLMRPPRMTVWPSFTVTLLLICLLEVVGVLTVIGVRTSSTVCSISRATRFPLRTCGVTFSMSPVSL